MAEMRSLILRNTGTGFVLAFVAIATLFAFDIGQLRALVFGSGTGVLAGAVLTFFLGLTLAATQIGIAVMNLGEAQPPKGLRWFALHWRMEPARVYVRVDNRPPDFKPHHRLFAREDV